MISRLPHTPRRSITLLAPDADAADRGERGGAKDKTRNKTPAGDPLDKIATKLGVTREQVEEVYEIEREELRLIVTPAKLDASHKVGTEQVALLLAAGRQAAELADNTESKAIRDVVDDYGKADSNFGKIISGMGQYFSLATEKSKNRPVRVRRSAFAAAGELVKSLTTTP